MAKFAKNCDSCVAFCPILKIRASDLIGPKGATGCGCCFRNFRA
jgi:flavoprotein